MTGLRGRRVVVTRAELQAPELAEALEEAGAEVIQCPTIEIAPPRSWTDLDQALARLDGYRWVVFTSTNGVRAVTARLRELGRSRADLDGSRVAAVGSSTARALGELGIRPAFVPEGERSRSLAETLEPVTGERILLTRADIANPTVAATLLERGAESVDDVVAYRTLFVAPTVEVIGELRRGVDGITFTSPSTVRGFVRLSPEWRKLLDGVVVATLGPATTEAARKEGIDVAAEARERSMEGLVRALGLAFEAEGYTGEESGK